MTSAPSVMLTTRFTELHREHTVVARDGLMRGKNMPVICEKKIIYALK